MISTDKLKNKEVINIGDGRSLGFVYDIEVDLDKGVIDGIVIPGSRGFMGLFFQGRGRYSHKMGAGENCGRRCHTRRYGWFLNLRGKSRDAGIIITIIAEGGYL